MQVAVRDRWHSAQGARTYPEKLQPGDVIAVDVPGMRHQPWVVHEVRPHEDRWRAYLRPIGAQYDFAQYNHGVSFPRWASVMVLPEHYSVCVRCGELPPCSEVWTGQVADAQTERAARYEVEGVCPACSEPVTRRQKAIRFEENLYVPLGPPVVYHQRSKCGFSAVQYDEKVAKSVGRDPRLSCAGHHVLHLDNVFQCTNENCPGHDKKHRAFSRCYVNGRCDRPECRALGG